jgi:hypothetical protein
VRGRTSRCSHLHGIFKLHFRCQSEAHKSRVGLAGSICRNSVILESNAPIPSLFEIKPSILNISSSGWMTTNFAFPPGTPPRNQSCTVGPPTHRSISRHRPPTPTGSTSNRGRIRSESNMGKQIALVAGGNKGPGKKLATVPQDRPSGGFFNDAGTVAW